jgi:hypothetical protein
MMPGEAADHATRFFSSENGGEAGWPACADRMAGKIDGLFKDVFVEKQDCVEGLILSRCGYLAVNCEMIEEGFEVLPSHKARVTFVVK